MERRDASRRSLRGGDSAKRGNRQGARGAERSAGSGQSGASGKSAGAGGGAGNGRHGKKPKERIPPYNKELTENLLRSVLENNKAIAEFKRQKNFCALCGKEIELLSESLSDKATGAPVHFDCARGSIAARERLAEGERLVYIGRGRFGAARTMNPRTGAVAITRMFEWEPENAVPAAWRAEMASLFSQVH